AHGAEQANEACCAESLNNTSGSARQPEFSARVYLHTCARPLMLKKLMLKKRTLKKLRLIELKLKKSGIRFIALFVAASLMPLVFLPDARAQQTLGGITGTV